VPEVRRLFLALTGTAEQRASRLNWSLWRRRHQASAARSHAARRARAWGRPPRTFAAVLSTAAPPELTDAEWELVRSLMPPQRPPTGRPRHDHRTLLSGIVWVLRTHSSWRDLPLEFGKWETAYKRYRLWQDTGLWQRLLALLGDDADRESCY
jgi:transposase